MSLSDVRMPAWASQTGFIFACIGAAVGLGNIWKFPYMTGVQGGGAFVLIYLASIFAIAIPIAAAELVIGRRGAVMPSKRLKISLPRAGNPQATRSSAHWGCWARSFY